MNGEVKYAIRRSAERFQQALLDESEGFASLEAHEGNKLAFLLTHTPRQYLLAFGAEEIDIESVRDCIDTLDISLPDEVFGIVVYHNSQCHLYEELSAHRPQLQYNINNKK